MSSRVKIKPNGVSGGIKFKKFLDTTAEDFESQENFFKKKLESIKIESYNKGREDAARELEVKFVNDLDEKRSEFKQIIFSIDEKIKNYEAAFEKIIVDLSFNVAETILKKNLERDSIITDTVAEAAKKIIGAGNLLVKLNPSDYKLVKDNSDKIFGEEFSKINFEEDNRIERGGCFVESEIGNVDGRISTQLNEIKLKITDNYLNNL